MKNETESRIVKLAIAGLSGLDNKKNTEPLSQIIQLGREYRSSYSGMAIGEIPGVEAARQLFKLIGIDPTKRRPSSEALLRRMINQKGYVSINTLVDIGNWCSLQFLLPLCVYDASGINGMITGRMGRTGDGYIAIDNKYLDLENRFLICDEQSAIGSPIKDSWRTKVTEDTTDSILVIYAPPSYCDDSLRNDMKTFINRILRYCGGKLIDLHLKHVRI